MYDAEIQLIAKLDNNIVPVFLAIRGSVDPSNNLVESFNTHYGNVIPAH